MRFEFVAGRPVLDFVATVAERGTTDDDALRTPADLETWVAEAGLLDQPIAIGSADLAEAKQGREAMYALITAALDGQRPADCDRLLVNRLANNPPPRRELSAQGELIRAGDLPAVLAVLANDCLDLYAGPDRAVLRRCAAPRCTRTYLDRSRGGRRRWCDMKGCGDKMKAAAYRSRQRAAGDGDQGT